MPKRSFCSSVDFFAHFADVCQNPIIQPCHALTHFLVCLQVAQQFKDGDAQFLDRANDGQRAVFDRNLLRGIVSSV
jgi:hypothetical protein